MEIIVDAFGGDNAPLEIIKGCVEAVAEYNINVTLTGDETKIKNVFSLFWKNRRRHSKIH